MINTKEIRKSLKASLGYSARQVSVKYDYYEVYFTIRCEKVNFEEVENFANQFQSIDRCVVTGEILSGGEYLCLRQTFPGVRVRPCGGAYINP